ncbi:hypothetical protein EYF80_010051 [Liparis tanakae]|uniref:Uncharacterized protein n=1 Tax=Liparis tanakae TaxID=230148 RepID=A0A4Z2IPE8_9TELE|nr:hypothetical protein EYF80_010051 [Liparis tanakae]
MKRRDWTGRAVRLQGAAYRLLMCLSSPITLGILINHTRTFFDRPRPTNQPDLLDQGPPNGPKEEREESRDGYRDILSTSDPDNDLNDPPPSRPGYQSVYQPQQPGYPSVYQPGFPPVYQTKPLHTCSALGSRSTNNVTNKVLRYEQQGGHTAEITEHVIREERLTGAMSLQHPVELWITETLSFLMVLVASQNSVLQIPEPWPAEPSPSGLAAMGTGAMRTNLDETLRLVQGTMWGTRAKV